jgi:dGTPase
MVNDLLEETRRRVAESGVQCADDVRAAGRALAGFSAQVAAEERQLKTFLYDRMYNSPPVQTVRVEAQRVIANLFAAYRADTAQLPPAWQPADSSEQSVVRAIGDFMAGFTDRYAIARHRELVGPVQLPEAF